MNLYLLYQEEKNDYDTYDSCVVAAEDIESARKIRPGGDEWPSKDHLYGTWATSPANVSAKLIGKATKDTAAGVILASFNAG